MQAILGHKHIDTTMNYVRLYDNTLAPQFGLQPNCQAGRRPAVIMLGEFWALAPSLYGVILGNQGVTLNIRLIM